MNDIFDNIFKTKIDDYIYHIVTPATPYLLCNHYISTELIPDIYKYKYLQYDIKIAANDLLKNNNYDAIKNLDIIQIQVDYLSYFYEKVLPIIINNNIKVIIITSQWHLPQIYQNELTDNILKNDNILLWISQNPIYESNNKYMAFPYGIEQRYVNKYMNFVKTCNFNIPKTINILNQHAEAWGHLANDHIRKQFDILGKNSGKRLDYKDYLSNIFKTEFMISTSGDRDDCYRHYECIGLNTIPISNIGNCYREIFEDNMIYANGNEMVEMINNKKVPIDYKKPNRDIITVKFWLNKINDKITSLL
jgi:hypothetical protein